MKPEDEPLDDVIIQVRITPGLEVTCTPFGLPDAMDVNTGDLPGDMPLHVMLGLVHYVAIKLALAKLVTEARASGVDVRDEVDQEKKPTKNKKGKK